MHVNRPEVYPKLYTVHASKTKLEGIIALLGKCRHHLNGTGYIVFRASVHAPPKQR